MCVSRGYGNRGDVRVEDDHDEHAHGLLDETRTGHRHGHAQTHGQSHGHAHPQGGHTLSNASPIELAALRALRRMIVGDDKPLTYPCMFRRAGSRVATKQNRAPQVRFNPGGTVLLQTTASCFSALYRTRSVALVCASVAISLRTLWSRA